MTTERVRPLRSARRGRTLIALVGAIFIASLAGLSARVVRGVLYPTLATAFVSSPSAGQDAPIPIVWGTRDTGLRVVCFYAANTSPARVDHADWPRVTAVGFELPGAPSGFTLLEPLDGDWELVEDKRQRIPGHEKVSLDFAIVARANREGWHRKRPHDPLGIPPGQLAARGSGTRFCLSGPFPDTLPNAINPDQPIPTTIEQILNGVVVGFQRVQPHGQSSDGGVWDNVQRTIPLYPE